MRLFLDVTAHGWGHLSQTAPVIATIRRRVPGLALTVRSGLPEDLLRDRLGAVERIIPSDTDRGIAMVGPFAVDHEETFRRTAALHTDWDTRVAEVRDTIRETRADAVLSNFGYLALAAARAAGVPSIGFSSLNWLDLFGFYCGGMPGAAPILARMAEAYRAAGLLLRLEPGMAMEALPTRPVPRPIARLGAARREALRRDLGAAPGVPVVLCAFGGMMPDEPPPFVRHPDGLVVIGPPIWTRHGIASLDRPGWTFPDLMASADAVVSKAGYGIVAEAGCLGLPSVMVSRGDWPEEPALLDWLDRHAPLRRWPEAATLDAATVREVASRPRPTRGAANGGEEEVAEAVIAAARGQSVSR